jgi:hypothetical protein
MSNFDDSFASSDDSSVVEDVEAMLRRALSEKTLDIGYPNEYHAILANVDSFLKLSQGNSTVEGVHLDPYWYRNRGRPALGCRLGREAQLGRVIGNFQSLKELDIRIYSEDEGEEAGNP